MVVYNTTILVALLTLFQLIIMLYQDWLCETYGANEFNIVDVNEDGSCGYNVMALALKYHYPNDELVVNSGDDLPRALQKRLAQYVIDHWNDNVIGDLGYITLEEAVIDTHDVNDINDYTNFFINYYAGDPDKIKIGENEVIIKSGKRKGQIMKKSIWEDIPVRWAGIPELYAFYKIYGIGLTVLHPEKWVERKKGVSGPVKAAIKSQFARFRCSLLLNNSSIDKMSIVLWDNKKTRPHFMYMTKKE